MEKGFCHICGKYSNLTFEHLPPQKAYNNKRAKVIQGEDILEQFNDTRKPWDFEGLKYKYSQRGIGLSSLCENCNNITGKWYANEYIKFSNDVLEFIYDKDMREINALRIDLKNFYPLRFLKQVIAMFASTFPDERIKGVEDLKKFILERDYNILDSEKFRITMYLLKNQRFAWTGPNHIVNIGNFKSIKEVASLDLYPLGFEFEFNPSGKSENLDITQFANTYAYNDKVNMSMTILARERNILYPCDYRTKNEIEEQSNKSKEAHIQLLSKEIKNSQNKNRVEELIHMYRENKINSAQFTLEMKKLI